MCHQMNHFLLPDSSFFSECMNSIRRYNKNTLEVFVGWLVYPRYDANDAIQFVFSKQLENIPRDFSQKYH